MACSPSAPALRPWQISGDCGSTITQACVYPDLLVFGARMPCPEAPARPLGQTTPCLWVQQLQAQDPPYLRRMPWYTRPQGFGSTAGSKRARQTAEPPSEAGKRSCRAPQRSWGSSPALHSAAAGRSIAGLLAIFPRASNNCCAGWGGGHGEPLSQSGAPRAGPAISGAELCGRPRGPATRMRANAKHAGAKHARTAAGPRAASRWHACPGRPWQRARPARRAGHPVVFVGSATVDWPWRAQRAKRKAAGHGIRGGRRTRKNPPPASLGGGEGLPW